MGDKLSLGSGSGTDISYIVEARSTYSEPQVHPSGQILDKDWRRVPAKVVTCDRRDHLGFPVTALIGDIPVRTYPSVAREHGYLNWEAAYAFACVFLSQASLCVECRIVSVKTQYSYSSSMESAGESISLNDLRRNAKFEVLAESKP